MAELTSAETQVPSMGNTETTELVELPAIMRGGQLTIADIDLRKLPHHLLKEIAKTMDGELVYVWRRIVYQELEVPMCCFKGCDRPAIGALFCSDHPNGRIPGLTAPGVSHD